MRVRKTTDVGLNRRQRRSVLAALVASVAVPAFATAQSPSPFQVVPPLPLNVPTATESVLDNPFCVPSETFVGDPTIRLAADSKESPIRMKPIGVAVGLRNIGEPDAPPPPTIFVTPTTETVVQSNPMAQSQDDVELTPTTVKELIDESAVAMVSADEDAEPIEFSLSDFDDAMTAESDADTVAEDHSETLPENILVDEAQTLGVVELAQPIDQPQLNSAPQPQALPPQPKDHATAPHRATNPHTEVSDSKTAADSVVSSDQRFRPPVDVAATPLAISRNDSPDEITIIRPAGIRLNTVQLVEDQPYLSSNSHLAVPKNAPTTPLHLSKAQVRALTIGGNVRQVSVDNQEICQAINAGTNEIKLIGTGIGSTRLVVWADTADNPAVRARVFTIHVDDAVTSTGDAVDDKMETLNQSIARAFPKCQVRVRQEQGQLVVAGKCGDSQSAEKILRLVRKTCLIPVVDELQLR